MDIYGYLSLRLRIHCWMTFFILVVDSKVHVVPFKLKAVNEVVIKLYPNDCTNRKSRVYFDSKIEATIFGGEA